MRLLFLKNNLKEKFHTLFYVIFIHSCFYSAIPQTLCLYPNSIHIPNHNPNQPRPEPDTEPFVTVFFQSLMLFGSRRAVLLEYILQKPVSGFHFIGLRGEVEHFHRLVWVLLRKWLYLFYLLIRIVA